MLDSIEKDNKTINQMYKGKELVWELPTIMTNNFNVTSGSKTISLVTYPPNCQITITVNDVIYKKVSDGFGSIIITLDETLKSRDNVDILIEKAGWKSLNNFIKVR